MRCPRLLRRWLRCRKLLRTHFCSLIGSPTISGSIYAMAARRHMHLFGTTSEQLGAVAVSQRKWAQMRKPMTLEDHQSSRFIVEPLHLLDCCLVSKGGVAVIITSAERAKTLKQPPVYVLGMGQAAPGDNQRTDRDQVSTQEPGNPERKR